MDKPFAAHALHTPAAIKTGNVKVIAWNCRRFFLSVTEMSASCMGLNTKRSSAIGQVG